MAWAAGLMFCPAIGGYLLERVGFESLLVGWAGFLLLTGLFLVRLK
jgi:hypothetical protein